MSQASSSSAASTPTNRTPNSKYTVTEDHEKKALMHGFLCEINDPKRRNARFTCQWCEKSPPRMFTIDCSKAYIRWNDMAVNRLYREKVYEFGIGSNDIH